MIRPASTEDIDEIMSIAKKTVRVMNAEGSDQWNESYPTARHFLQDLNKQSLFVLDTTEHIAGFIVIDQHIDPRFQQMTWTYLDRDAGTFHRLAVDPDRRQHEVASQLIRFAESRCASMGLKTIKVDTYERNHSARSLFERLGYGLVGHSRKGTGKPFPFYYYEKILINREEE
ncbi:GNAT family N-acetyltransferase [Salicibibacter kimchii]|uniref:GNAT family N-acetyltransferase n=1 Tax=Salicibibacter kimchii TaxID=2099786 RepID=A0A345BZT8_9BACI|nr:GNAT family N-acetyltransferase [Salicibibacter kimchii]AXF56469.1 GNAT family N-acetyltransferase [Salicibibacter kimchii]